MVPYDIRLRSCVVAAAAAVLSPSSSSYIFLLPPSLSVPFSVYFSFCFFFHSVFYACVQCAGKWCFFCLFELVFVRYILHQNTVKNECRDGDGSAAWMVKMYIRDMDTRVVESSFRYLYN